MSDWEFGDRVFGQLYSGRGTASGKVLDVDPAGDVRIEIEATSVDFLDVGARAYLVGSSVVSAVEIGESPVPTHGHTEDRIRVMVLRDAETLITGDRNASYGEPTQNFTDTSDVWTAVLRHKLRDGERIDPGDVAALMVGLKLVRRTASGKMDHWTDMAGYAACGAEADVSSGRIVE